MIENARELGSPPRSHLLYPRGRSLPSLARPNCMAPERGAVTILFTFMVVVMLGFIGMALDLSLIYNRKSELQGLASAAALAGANTLNGTQAGVTNAIAQAIGTLNVEKYKYNQLPVTGNAAAISFGVTSDGPWLDAVSAPSFPDGLLFVKIDTGMLDAALGTVNLNFMKIVSSALASASARAQAVAGRSTIQITPLAVCALSNAAAASRANPGPPANSELVEFGFRRGVGYDLMQLNPAGSVAENFVIDPVDPPGVAGTASNTSANVVGPFVCAGLLAMPRVTGGAITVGRPFPLGSLFNQLNSRFDQYNGGLCNVNMAPPDTNIKSYAFNAIPWMSAQPDGQTALSTTSGGKLWTIADTSLPASAGNTALMYGPLWVGARAVPFSSYTPGVLEPASGYTPFIKEDWLSLYKPGQPSATAYPAGASTPYKATSGVNFLASAAAHKPIARRRILNVPLLSCPVGSGPLSTATVLGIGRFLMTVPATATSIYAEFEGAVPEQSLGGLVELYQ